MVVENPYKQPHYLTSFFPIRPKVIIQDRHAEGDYYRKPTQFFFVNCEPEQNVVFEPIEQISLANIERARSTDTTRQVNRSLIHPQFADRFIKAYILTNKENLWF